MLRYCVKIAKKNRINSNFFDFLSKNPKSLVQLGVCKGYITGLRTQVVAAIGPLPRLSYFQLINSQMHFTSARTSLSQ